jgi:hypothetical protein
MSAPLAPSSTVDVRGHHWGGHRVSDRPRAELHVRGVLLACALGALMWVLLFLAARGVAGAV